MPARSALGTALAALLALLCSAAPAAASPNGTAAFERLGSGNEMRLDVRITENSMRFLRLMLPPSAPALIDLGAVTPGTCTKTGDRSGECTLDAPAGPGQTVRVGVPTTSRYPDGLGGQVELCSDPACNPGFSRTIPVTGPGAPSAPPAEEPPAEQPPPADPFAPPPSELCADGLPRPCANVFARVRVLPVRRTGAIASGERGAPPSAVIPIEPRGGNAGPDAAANTALRADILDAPTELLQGGRAYAYGCAHRDASGVGAGESGRGAPPTCTMASLGPHESLTLLTPELVVRRPGRYVVRAVASSDTRDPDPANNVAEQVVDVDVIPVAEITRRPRRPAAGQRISIGGTTNAEQVRIALARREGGVVRFQRTRRRAAAGCRWLVNRRGRTRRERGARCDEPTWMKARRRGERWSFVLPRGLRPGRYTVLARGALANGVLQGSISRRGALELRVRRSRRR